MSRYSLHRPRRPQVVWDHTASGTRLLPTSSSNTVSLGNPLPRDGRSIDCRRQSPSKGLCRYSAPSSGRFGFATSGDTLEHSVTILPGAFVPSRSIAPYGYHAYRGLRSPWGLRAPSSIMPFCDSIPRHHRRIPSGTPRRRVDVPSPTAVERCYRTDAPHTETPSNLTRLLRHVWGYSRIAADVEHPLGRTLDVGAGVVVFLCNSHGPSIASPSVPSPVGATGWSPWGGASSPTTHERNRLLAHTPIISHAHPFPSPGAPFPRKARKNLLGTIKQARAFD